MVRERGLLHVGEPDRVDEALVLARALLEIEHELGAARAAHAVRAEGVEVRALRGIGGIVPVAHVQDRELARIASAGPLHQLRERAVRGIGAEEARRLAMTDVEQVRRRGVRRDRLDEVALDTLGDQDCAGHSVVSVGDSGPRGGRLRCGAGGRGASLSLAGRLRCAGW
ncbi:Hypothetical protein I5071_3750 [Sandaracinus amylolyticus]|nr:Hypothetical protein I5071_3750 [Sandaracinus amylolyticus]